MKLDAIVLTYGTREIDGTEADDVDVAAHNNCHTATDEWASVEYRMGVASTLAKRCLENLM